MIFVLGITFSSCKKDDTTADLDDQITSGEVDDAQNNRRSCGHDHHMEQLMADPEFRAKHEAKLEKLTKELYYVESRSGCTTPKVIPVAIHFQNINNASIACLRTLAQAQVDILNADFGGTNSDISTWNNTAAAYFPGVDNGEACLKFCIADKNHPAGFGLNNGDPAVTLNKTTGDNNAQWSGYLNFYVRPNTGYLGYAPLGGSGNGDGVVIDAAAFGTGNGCGQVSANSPYDLGRTVTHELGHYLLLDHIWGNGCNTDDDVADTPSQASDNSGCPNFSTTSCGSRDMHMNYMDYTNDACMYMFSAGQINRVEAYVNSSLSNLTNNAVNKCSEAGTGGGTGGGGTTSTCEVTAIASTVSNITASQARINWNTIPDAVSHKLRYRKAGTTAWTEITTTQTTKVLTNLSAASTYQYQIRTQCPIGWTPYNSTSTFITLTGGTSGDDCVKPTTSSVTNIATNAATVGWNAVPGAIRYRIRYRVQGTTNWTGKNTTTNSKTLTGLQAGKNYQYQIRTQCAAGWTGFTSNQLFTTTSNGGGTTGCNGVDVRVKVKLDYYGSETTWELLNENFNQVAVGGPYADNQEGAVKNKDLCLPEGCYTLYIDDAYGDGICCDYGNGFLKVISGGQVIGESDGYFGYYDVIEFCVDEEGARVTNQRKDTKAAKPLKTMSE